MAGGGEATTMRCKKCQSRNLVVVRSGPHSKLVCEECLTFQKFLSKADAKTFDQLKQPAGGDKQALEDS